MLTGHKLIIIESSNNKKLIQKDKNTSFFSIFLSNLTAHKDCSASGKLIRPAISAAKYDTGLKENKVLNRKNAIRIVNKKPIAWAARKS